MAVGLDDALLGWLAGKTGDVLLGGLRDSPTQKAMRAVVDEAVEAAVNSPAGHLDHGQAEHLRDVLAIREVWRDTPAPVSSRAGLEAALRTWTAALDQPEHGEAGYLSRLGNQARQRSALRALRVAYMSYGHAPSPRSQRSAA